MMKDSCQNSSSWLKRKLTASQRWLSVCSAELWGVTGGVAAAWEGEHSLPRPPLSQASQQRWNCNNRFPDTLLLTHPIWTHPILDTCHTVHSQYCRMRIQDKHHTGQSHYWDISHTRTQNIPNQIIYLDQHNTGHKIHRTAPIPDIFHTQPVPIPDKPYPVTQHTDTSHT